MEPDPDDSIIYRDDSEYAEHFGSILTTAVNSRLRSSSAVEVLLSGGLDSGSVASIAGLENEQEGLFDIQARYWKPPVGATDEEPYVDAIADRYNIPVHKVDVSDHWAMRESEFPVRFREHPVLGSNGLSNHQWSGIRDIPDARNRTGDVFFFRFASHSARKRVQTCLWFCSQ